MTNRKSQNSILFLTTLGVYLGLVLVGATPQVLAQAATAKQFNVKDEIEVKDDLDRNPNGRLPFDALENYLNDVESLIDELKDLPRGSVLHSLRTPFEVTASITLPCIKGSRTGFGSSGNTVKSDLIWPSFRNLSNRLNAGYDLGDCVPNEKVGRVTESRHGIRLDDQAFSIEVEIRKASPQAAQALLDALVFDLKNYDLGDASLAREKIVASSSFHAENNQVFIVTRLPRGSLDSLLATDAR